MIERQAQRSASRQISRADRAEALRRSPDASFSGGSRRRCSLTPMPLVCETASVHSTSGGSTNPVPARPSKAGTGPRPPLLSALSGTCRAGGKMPVESRMQVIPRGHDQRCREPAAWPRWAVSFEEPPAKTAARRARPSLWQRGRAGAHAGRDSLPSRTASAARGRGCFMRTSDEPLASRSGSAASVPPGPRLQRSATSLAASSQRRDVRHASQERREARRPSAASRVWSRRFV